MLASTIQLIGFVDILPLSYYKELSQGIDLTPQDIDQLTRVKVESTISAVSRGGGLTFSQFISMSLALLISGS